MVDHNLQLSTGGEGCHVEAHGEQCAVVAHVEDWGEATVTGVHHLVEVDHLLLPIEEARHLALDPLQQELQGCSPLQPCPTNRDLQHHSPKLMAMKIM